MRAQATPSQLPNTQAFLADSAPIGYFIRLFATPILLSLSPCPFLPIFAGSSSLDPKSRLYVSNGAQLMHLYQSPPEKRSPPFVPLHSLRTSYFSSPYGAALRQFEKGRAARELLSQARDRRSRRLEAGASSTADIHGRLDETSSEPQIGCARSWLSLSCGPATEPGLWQV